MNHKTIAESLIKIREATGYSVEQLAKLIDAEPEEVLQWETGKEEPKISQCILLSKLYAVELDDIFDGCKSEEFLTSEKVDDFKHEAWINCIAT